MHIAITYDSPIPAHGYGGTERIAWWLGRHLNRLGHRVTYVVPPGSTCDFAQVVFHDRDRPIESQIPDDVDLVHDFGAVTRPVDHPMLTTFHGNGHPGLRLPRNTVFLCRNHAERHGGSVFVYNGIDPSYESGTTPHADFLITLALQENVSLDWLLLGKGRPRRR